MGSLVRKKDWSKTGLYLTDTLSTSSIWFLSVVVVFIAYNRTGTDLLLASKFADSRESCVSDQVSNDHLLGTEAVRHL